MQMRRRPAMLSPRFWQAEGMTGSGIHLLLIPRLRLRLHGSAVWHKTPLKIVLGAPKYISDRAAEDGNPPYRAVCRTGIAIVALSAVPEVTVQTERGPAPAAQAGRADVCRLGGCRSPKKNSGLLRGPRGALPDPWRDLDLANAGFAMA